MSNSTPADAGYTNNSESRSNLKRTNANNDRSTELGSTEEKNNQIKHEDAIPHLVSASDAAIRKDEHCSYFCKATEQQNEPQTNIDIQVAGPANNNLPHSITEDDEERSEPDNSSLSHHTLDPKSVAVLANGNYTHRNFDGSYSNSKSNKSFNVPNNEDSTVKDATKLASYGTRAPLANALEGSFPSTVSYNSQKKIKVSVTENLFESEDENKGPRITTTLLLRNTAKDKNREEFLRESKPVTTSLEAALGKMPDSDDDLQGLVGSGKPKLS